MESLYPAFKEYLDYYTAVIKVPNLFFFSVPILFFFLFPVFKEYLDYYTAFL